MAKKLEAKRDGGRWLIVGDGGRVIASTEDAQLARLFAAAPDLLWAAELMMGLHTLSEGGYQRPLDPETGRKLQESLCALAAAVDKAKRAG